MFPNLTRRLANGARNDTLKSASNTTATTTTMTRSNININILPRVQHLSTTAAVRTSNPHQARKIWPPDFSKLNPQQQLRFEKKYKRRLRNASRAPRWEKGLKYAQLATIAAALVWLFFYAEFEWWGRKYKPYEEMQKHARNVLGVEWTKKPFEKRREEPDLPSPEEEKDSKRK